MLTLSSENLLEITFETKPRRGLVARQLTSVAKEEDYLPPPPPPHPHPQMSPTKTKKQQPRLPNSQTLHSPFSTLHSANTPDGITRTNSPAVRQQRRRPRQPHLRQRLLRDQLRPRVHNWHGDVDGLAHRPREHGDGPHDLHRERPDAHGRLSDRHVRRTSVVCDAHGRRGRDARRACVRVLRATLALGYPFSFHWSPWISRGL